jgi:hypothetical protein
MCLLGLAGAQHSQSPRDAEDRAVIIEAYSQPTVAYVKKCTQDEFCRNRPGSNTVPTIYGGAHHRRRDTREKAHASALLTPP